MADQVKWYRWSDMPKEKVTSMLDRRLITGDRMMLAHVYLKKGCLVPMHQHENEQFGHVADFPTATFVSDQFVFSGDKVSRSSGTAI